MEGVELKLSLKDAEAIRSKLRLYAGLMYLADNKKEGDQARELASAVDDAIASRDEDTTSFL